MTTPPDDPRADEGQWSGDMEDVFHRVTHLLSGVDDDEQWIARSDALAISDVRALVTFAGSARQAALATARSHRGDVMTDREKETLVAIGKGVGGGIIREIGRWVLIGFAVVALLQLVAGWMGYGWDSADNRDTGARSGVRLRMDHGTGCQYLEGQSGGLAPRLDRDGKQVCRP